MPTLLQRGYCGARRSYVENIEGESRLTSVERDVGLVI